MAWKDGKRVGFGTREFQTSTRWIRLANPGYTIYAMADSSHPSSDQPPPPSGLGISASDAEELSSLVNSKTPVTITEQHEGAATPRLRKADRGTATAFAGNPRPF